MTDAIETPDPEVLVLEQGEDVPEGTPAGTLIFVKTGGGDQVHAGTVAPMLDDGCLGQHYPDSNPDCTENH